MKTKSTSKTLLMVVLPIILTVLIIFLVISQVRENNGINVTNFGECIAAGNPVIKSYPRQCRHDDQVFTEEIDRVGGDRDEHGCIGSAGYSWCESKNKCLRVWEESCYEDLSQEIQYLLANKYDKPIDQVNITITKQTDSHAAGSVLFGDGGPGEGGVFLAVKIGEIWQVVFDGNGDPDCNKMREEYQFPDEILEPNFCN